MFPVSLPSPSTGVWYIGSIPLRAYGMLIALAMLISVWWGAKRYASRGGSEDTVYDVALWAIPLGIVGARLYHVVTSPEAYFGAGGDPLLAFAIWNGGLGSWGGVAGGALGVWLCLRRSGQRIGPLADALVPPLLLAQAIGRWGNWFNQELFGAPTTLPWGLRIDAAHMPAGYPEGTLFHPTFLYESLWNLAAMLLILWCERHLRLKAGQLFGMYLMTYTAGRAWIEMLRIDTAHAFLGIRLNVWTSLLVFVGGLALVLYLGHRGGDVRVDPSELPSGASSVENAEEDEAEDLGHVHSQDSQEPPASAHEEYELEATRGEQS